MTTKCIDTINPKVFFADAKEIWIAVALLQKHIAKQLLSNAKTLDTNHIHNNCRYRLANRAERNRNIIQCRL